MSRRLVNNWLFGETSPLLSGRLDSEVYGNSCSELKNMFVHRQGGVSRRPPLKKLIGLNEKYVKLIPFTIDVTNSFIILFGEGKLAVYDFNDESLTDLSDILDEDTWANITEEECTEVKFANYYNDLYLVHKNYPLMRLKYTGVNWTLGLPKVYVNQDIKPNNIVLSFTWGVAINETVSFVFNGEPHSIIIHSGDSVQDFINSILSIEYTGWKCTQLNTNSVIFKADKYIDKYRDYDFEGNDFTFKKASGSVASFDWIFSLSEDTDKSGLVYGSDDFLPMNLNTEDEYGKHYASDIAIISEKMWLVVNGNPSKIYVSRPYGTSQIVYPKDSNDTILDFIQFEIVTTDTETMKDQNDLKVVIGKDSNGDTIYDGTSTNQQIWEPPAESDITTYKSLQDWKTGKYNEEGTLIQDGHQFNLTYVEGSPTIVDKIYKRNGSLYIKRSLTYFLTEDEEYDSTKIYYVKNGSIYERATIENQGLVYYYFKTQDIYINSKTMYFTWNGTDYVAVQNPERSQLPNYFERRIELGDEVYEYGYQYFIVNAQEQPTTLLKATYLGNGMIGTLSDSGVVLACAIPYYQYDLSIESELYTTNTEVDKIATASTGMELQLATGRNDKISWIALGNNVYVGTESAEWIIDTDINALDGSANMYSSFGSNNGLKSNVGTDVIFLQRGNTLRLLYKDYYGNQNLELSLVNPEILEGTVKCIASTETPEPIIYALKADNTIVALCLDRNNGVQAFAKWDFDLTRVNSLSIAENSSKQIVVALCEEQILGSDNYMYLGYFDIDETTVFKDAGIGYFESKDEEPEDKTYYEFVNGNFVEFTGTVTNPVEQGLYEFGIADYVNQYVSRMTANPFDTQLQDGSLTIGEAKNVSKILFRCYNTGKVVTYYNAKDKQTSRSPVCSDKNNEYIGGLADFSINVNGGTTRDLMITVESFEEQPLTLLAMAYDLRVNING